MQEISLERDSNNSGGIHCFLCGTLSRAADGKVDICDHLVYIHCQGEDLPIFDRYGIYSPNADDDGTLDKFNEKYDNELMKEQKELLKYCNKILEVKNNIVSVKQNHLN